MTDTPETPDAPETLTAGETATELGIPIVAVRELIYAGSLDGAQDNPHAPWRITRASIERYRSGREPDERPEMVRELGKLTDEVEACQAALDNALAARADALVRWRDAGAGPHALSVAARLRRQWVQSIIRTRRGELAQQAAERTTREREDDPERRT